jgi:hypothetical protein
MAKLHSISFSNSSRCPSFMSACASMRVASGVSFCAVRGFMLPCDFMLGANSLAMKRSEPPAWLMAASSLCM